MYNKIFLSFGHQGDRESGCINRDDGLSETRELQTIRSNTIDFLRKHPDFAKNKVTPIALGINLDNRIALVNKFATKNDIAIEFHFDISSTKTGCGIYYKKDKLFSKANYNKAQELIQLFSDSTNKTQRVLWIRPSSSSRFGKLGFIDDVKCDSYIIECGSLDKEDVINCRKWIPSAIIKIIDQYLS